MEIKHCRLSTKGQLTIPKEFREKLNINAGDEVILYLKDEKIIVAPKIMHIKMLRGLLREEIDVEKVYAFLKSERKKWRL